MTCTDIYTIWTHSKGMKYISSLWVTILLEILYQLEIFPLEMFLVASYQGLFVHMRMVQWKLIALCWTVVFYFIASQLEVISMRLERYFFFFITSLLASNEATAAFILPTSACRKSRANCIISFPFHFLFSSGMLSFLPQCPAIVFAPTIRQTLATLGIFGLSGNICWINISRVSYCWLFWGWGSCGFPVKNVKCCITFEMFPSRLTWSKGVEVPVLWQRNSFPHTAPNVWTDCQPTNWSNSLQTVHICLFI